MDITIKAIALGYIGVIMHCCLKYRSLSKDAVKANVILSIGDYIKKDIGGLVITFLCPIAWILLSEEVFVHYPKLENWYIGLSGVIGLAGSYLIQSLDNSTKNYIRKIVDKKTDIADNKD